MKPSRSGLAEISSTARRFLHRHLPLVVVLFCGLNQVQGALQLGVDLENNRPRLVWNSTTGSVYQVLSRRSLSSAGWEKVATIVSTGSASEWSDPTADKGTRFYRLLQGEAGLHTRLSVVHASAVPPLVIQTLTNGTYTAARSLIETFAPTGQFHLPLPLPNLDPFPEIVIGDVEIHFDDENR